MNKQKLWKKKKRRHENLPEKMMKGDNFTKAVGGVRSKIKQKFKAETSNGNES